MTDFDLFNYYNHLCSPVAGNCRYWIGKGVENSIIPEFAGREEIHRNPYYKSLFLTQYSTLGPADYELGIPTFPLIHFIRSYPFLLTVSYKNAKADAIK